MEYVRISEREQRKIIYKLEKHVDLRWKEFEQQLNTILEDGILKVILSTDSIELRDRFKRTFRGWKDFLIEFGMFRLPGSLFRLSKTYPDRSSSRQSFADESTTLDTGWYSSFELVNATLQTID